jgi:hypothetical protein
VRVESPTIADLLAEWRARQALEPLEALEEQQAEPLEESTRRAIAHGEAARHRMNAGLARRLAGQGDTTEAERSELLRFAETFEAEADRLDPSGR